MARVATGVGIAVGVGVGCGVGCGWQRGAVGREGRSLGVVSWRCGGAGVPLAAAARAVGWGDGTGVCEVPVLRRIASAGVVLLCAGHGLWGRSGPRLVGHGVAHQSTQNQQHNHPQIKSTAHQSMIGRAGNGSRTRWVRGAGHSRLGLRRHSNAHLEPNWPPALAGLAPAAHLFDKNRGAAMPAQRAYHGGPCCLERSAAGGPCVLWCWIFPFLLPVGPSA